MTEASTGIGRVVYVNASAQGADDGTSWGDAFRDLQSALGGAQAGQQIWVAQGTYYPTSGSDRDQSFVLRSGVELYGGFVGGETGVEEADWQKNATILSGNIGDPDSTQDNCRHVVTGADDAVLDGFFVQDGDALAGSPMPGRPALGQAAGAHTQHMTPESVLRGNDTAGAGIYNYQAAPIIRNTVVQNCRAGKGGGVYNMTTVSLDSPSRPPVFVNVTVRDNYAAGRGGGMANDLSTSPAIINCVFEGNECRAKGGGLYDDFSCSPLIVNTIFRGNRAHMAAAVGNDGTSNPLIVGCTITDNVCEDIGAGLYQGSYQANSSVSANVPTVINTVIKDNHSESHGPGDWVTWGEDWIRTCGSEIGDWDASLDDQALGAEYAELIEVAETVASLDAKDLWERFGTLLMPHIPRPVRGARGMQFGVDKPVLTSVELPAKVFYVNASSAASAPDGTSWATAFPDVQAGTDAASAAGGGEVWVAGGTYRPGKDRDCSFVMREHVGLFGGFEGTETQRDGRDWNRNQTILSGAIGGSADDRDNVYHVVRGCVNAVLDGFVVRDGRADGKIIDGYGGGMINWGYEASAIVRNTVFTDNYARDGGAVFCFRDSRCYFENVTITNNRANMGGGLSLRFGCSVRLDDCLIGGNFAEYRGGGAVVNYGSNPEFNRVTFTGNKTAGSGGALWVVDQASQYGGTEPVLNGCVLADNQAVFDGGALANYDSAFTTLRRCSFSQNKALRGSAISNTLDGRLTMTDTPVRDEEIYSD